MQLITGVGSAEMSHIQDCSVKIFKEHCRYVSAAGAVGVDANEELKLM